MPRNPCIKSDDDRRQRLPRPPGRCRGRPGRTRFNAEVRIRRVLSDAKPIVETVSCLKVNAALAEQPGERWAKRHVDLLHEEGSR